MLNTYVQRTGNTTILGRGLQLAHQELVWWENNRVINVTSPYSNVTRRVAHFAVNNTAPRPEVSKDGQEPSLMCRGMWRTTRQRLAHRQR